MSELDNQTNAIALPCCAKSAKRPLQKGRAVAYSAIGEPLSNCSTARRPWNGLTSDKRVTHPRETRHAVPAIATFFPPQMKRDKRSNTPSLSPFPLITNPRNPAAAGHLGRLGRLGKIGSFSSFSFFFLFPSYSFGFGSEHLLKHVSIAQAALFVGFPLATTENDEKTGFANR